MNTEAVRVRQGSRARPELSAGHGLVKVGIGKTEQPITVVTSQRIFTGHRVDTAAHRYQRSQGVRGLEEEVRR